MSDIPLREYIENQLYEQDKRTNLKFTQIERRMEDNAKALEIQAREYERRLEALNGEAGRIRNIQDTYVPRETFEAYQKERADADKRLAEGVEVNARRFEDELKELRGSSKGGAAEIWTRGLAVIAILIAAAATFNPA